MKEYVEREAIIQEIKESKNSFSPTVRSIFDVEIHLISNAPAADVVEIIYGRWLKQENETYLPVEFDENNEPILHKYIYYKCSLCGRTENQKEPYCNCGAKMIEEN